MDQANVRGRECLDIAGKYVKQVTVMEPCKCGTLVNIPEEAEKLMKDYAPEASVASWAMRFAASQPGVFRANAESVSMPAHSICRLGSFWQMLQLNLTNNKNERSI